MKRAFFGIALVTGCGRHVLADNVVPDRVTRDASAAMMTPADASGPEVSSSRFAVVATSPVELLRVVGGPVLGVSAGKLLLTLGRDGTVAPVVPVVTYASEHLALDVGESFGRIAGVWPELYVEAAIPGGRAETVLDNFRANVDDGKAEPKRYLTKTDHFVGHMADVSPWSKGRVLGFVSDDSSLMMGDDATRSGEFVLLAGPRGGAVPKLPKIAAPRQGRIVGYPSGRLFVRAGMRRAEDSFEADPMGLWEIEEDKPARYVKMGGEVSHLVRGRTEGETLAAGKRPDGSAYIARFDGQTWIDVALGASEPVLSIDSGDDGVVYAVTGSRVSDTIVRSTLWRAEFPKLDFVSVPIPPGMRPMSVALEDDRNVWVTAQTGERRGSNARLLHSQPALSTVSSLDEDALRRVAFAQKDPVPWTRACHVPFLALGGEADVTEADMKVWASGKDWAWGAGMLGRTKAGTFWGFPGPTTYVPTEVKAKLPQLLAVVKKKQPGAKLFCTMPVVQKTLD